MLINSVVRKPVRWLGWVRPSTYNLGDYQRSSSTVTISLNFQLEHSIVVAAYSFLPRLTNYCIYIV